MFKGTFGFQEEFCFSLGLTSVESVAIQPALGWYAGRWPVSQAADTDILTARKGRLTAQRGG